jgi:hypothetical protein
MVAGQPAYQLSLAPKTTKSLVGQIRIAIAAHGSYALRLQVFARGATSPAFSLGYTSLTLGRPAASNFSFTPPAGAKVKTVHVPTAAWAPPSGHWSGRSMPMKGRSSGSGHVNAGGVNAGGGNLGAPGGGNPGVSGKQAGRSSAPHGSLYANQNDGPSYSTWAATGTAGFTPLPGATVEGQGWLSVLVVPAFTDAGDPNSTWGSASTSLAYTSNLSITVVPSSSSQSSSSTQTTSTVSAPDGPSSPDLRALLRAATPVHGSWGSGHLLRTSLFSVLITSKGTTLIGAVAPSVLYADAATVK